MRKRILLSFFLVPIMVWSQSDSIVQLDYQVFIERVLEHHPRVYQAEIAANRGDAELLKSRGSFDPKLEGSIQQKYFTDDQYYSLINGGLKIPTWFGITAKAGYDQNQGVYLNPMERVPLNGLWYAGIEVELGKGLFIDERRAELKKAKLYQQGTELERKMILNELIFEASQAYWDWMSAYYQKEVYEEAVSNAELRLEGVRGTVIFGDRPAIDTVEASIQWQNRLFGYNQTKMELQNAKEKLQLFLWQEGVIPLEISNAIPVQLASEQVSGMFSLGLEEKDSLISYHPYLILNNLKLEQSEIDLRLKREQLKPGVTLKYNALSEPIDNDLFANYSVANYNWGGSISYPILSRKERGDLQLTKLKIEDQKWTNAQLLAKVGYNVQVAENKLVTSIDQLFLYEQTLNYFEQLYQAEQNLFEMGESSLFMINARERSFIDARLIRIELLAKALISGHELHFQLVAGVE